MNLLMKSFLTVITLMIVLLMVMFMLSKKSIIDSQKSSPFECGFNPMSYSRIPFSIHFFLIAVIFLIFDIEIILILPMILTMKSSMAKMWMITSWTFTTILIVGLYHEWNSGMMKWTS
uniref:NADH-ubiquinone oxidoreductase chain 3 n=1 Tax=Penthimia melanocephala TaxID=2777567 RepID=A0A7L8UV62_9HEMI|nr:NADH dehydrogenase subunit 3 [Penthimia melanocephala]QOG08894.1 NADH dehydrogenase subunit 3 [Penthimia melanocephala]